MDGVGAFQILSDTGFSITMGLKVSAVAVKNILRSLPTDSDAMMKVMKDDSLWMDSTDIATTHFVQMPRDRDA